MSNSPSRLVVGPEVLDRLTQSKGDPTRHIVIRGATVLTMDLDRRDLASGDVHIVGDTIEGVEPHDQQADYSGSAIVVPAEGCIVTPGIQDTHRHSWQTQLRRMVTNVDLERYIEVILATIAPHYRPEDIRAATLLSDLAAIGTGTTSVMDFAHNSRSAAFVDASVEAHGQSGIRHVLAVAPVMQGAWDEQWPADVGRLTGTPQSALSSVRLGVFGAIDLTGEAIGLTRRSIETARALGVHVIADATFGPGASANLVALGREGVLGPDVTLIHCTALEDDAWRAIAAAGVQVSLSSTSDAEIGILDANPPIQKALEFGVRPGLSVDVECTLSSDMFAQIRSTYTLQRMQAFLAMKEGRSAPPPMSPRRVLEMATVDGARVNGLDHLVGTLTPGRQADLVIFSAEDLFNMPLNNAVATVTLGCDTSSVRDVFIAGDIRKWQGDMVGIDFDRLLESVNESRDYLAAASGYNPGLLD